MEKVQQPIVIPEFQLSSQIVREMVEASVKQAQRLGFGQSFSEEARKLLEVGKLNLRVWEKP